jgi:hypothetical protein
LEAGAGLRFFLTFPETFELEEGEDDGFRFFFKAAAEDVFEEELEEA